MATLYNPKIITTGLVLYLDAGNRRSYSGSGTTWTDISVNNYSAILTNGPTFNSNNCGVLTFNGTNQFVTGSNSDIFTFGTGNFTVSYWVYINQFSGTGTPIFVDLRNTDAGAGYADYIATDNKYKLYWSSADRYTSTTTINVQTWYNITSIRQSSTLSVYINGTLDGTATDSTNLNGTSFRLARNVNLSGTSYLNGSIALFQMYNRALSAQEILQNFNALRGRFGA